MRLKNLIVSHWWLTCKHVSNVTVLWNSLYGCQCLAQYKLKWLSLYSRIILETRDWRLTRLRRGTWGSWRGSACSPCRPGAAASSRHRPGRSGPRPAQPITGEIWVTWPAAALWLAHLVQQTVQLEHVVAQHRVVQSRALLLPAARKLGLFSV